MAGEPLLYVASFPPNPKSQANLAAEVSLLQTITNLKGKKVAMWSTGNRLDDPALLKLPME